MRGRPVGWGHEAVVKVCPQKWKASASPGLTAAATSRPAARPTIASPARASRPRREVPSTTARAPTSGIEPAASRSRCSAVASTLSSWPSELNVPFASTVPSSASATADRRYGNPALVGRLHAAQRGPARTPPAQPAGANPPERAYARPAAEAAARLAATAAREREPKAQREAGEQPGRKVRRDHRADGQ